MNVPYEKKRVADVFYSLLPAGKASVAPKSAKLSALFASRATGNDFLDLFAELICHHGNRDVKAYAQRLGVRASTLSAMVADLSDCGAQDWVRAFLRLASCELLRKTDWPMAEVGRVLGFSASGSSFSQFFKREMRQQPFAFRYGFTRTGR